MTKLSPDALDFYLVTDSGLSRRGTAHDVKEALRAGCGIVQYREKERSTRGMIEEAARLRDQCSGRAVFLVNDRVDVALAVGADGVHVGQDDMPYGIARELLGEDAVIGMTVHDVPEAVAAEQMGADYVGLSPIFSTGTKVDAGAPCGVDMIARVREHIGIPIVVIGGINAQNVCDTIAAGASGAVAISAVVAGDDVYGAVSEFRRLIRESRPA